jgi:holo-[acyl-carrier protein] synthase
MIRLGTDIVYMPRIKAAVERFGDRFLQRVYTFDEQQDCGYTQDDSSRLSINQLAGRWAAKEAVAKALGTGWRGVSYTDIEIRRLPTGAPQVFLHHSAAAQTAGWGDCHWQLSISHDGDYSIATAILVCSP